MAFDCSRLAHLHFTSTEPFASGTHKEVLRGKLDGVDVAIKRMRRMALHGAAPEVTARDFVHEAMLMALLRSPMHIELIGHCFREDEGAINVVRYAVPWREIVPDAALLTFAARVDVAARLVDMLAYWAESPFGALVHCDMYTFQFALLREGGRDAYRPLLIDLDGLHPAPVAMDRQCSVDSECAHRCYKGDHYRAKVVGAFEVPHEVRCLNGRCGGYDERFNVWTVCRLLFFDLFQLGTPDAVVPSRRLDTLTGLIHECADPDPSKRPSLRRLRAKLEHIQV